MMARWFSNMAEKRSGFMESFGSIAMLYLLLLAEVGGSIAVLCLKGLKDYLRSFLRYLKPGLFSGTRVKQRPRKS